MNAIVLSGRLTKDPERRETASGKVFTTFSIAVRKRFKPQDPNERDADFFNVKVWGQSAEYVANYGAKGRLIEVSGRMESRRYTNNAGVEATAWDVIAETARFLDGVKEDGGTTAATPAPASKAAPADDDDWDPFNE